MYCANTSDEDWASICDCWEAERCLPKRFWDEPYKLTQAKVTPVYDSERDVFYTPLPNDYFKVSEESAPTPLETIETAMTEENRKRRRDEAAAHLKRLFGKAS